MRPRGEMVMSLICPFEARIMPGGREEMRGSWACVVLSKQGSRPEAMRGRNCQGHVLSFRTRFAPGSREGTREPWGLFCLLEQGLLLGPREAVGPHLSFGTSIAPGDRERTRRPWACIVLWKQGSRPEAVRGRGSHGASFVLRNKGCA